MLALVGGAAFYYGEKGETVSVIGSLVYSLNFISMIALFVYAQVKVFSSQMSDCQALVPSSETKHSFAAQRQVVTFYIMG